MKKKDQRSHPHPKGSHASPDPPAPGPKAKAKTEASSAQQLTEKTAAGPGGEEPPAPGIPSSLAVDRRGSAARTGRAEMAQRRREHPETSPEVSGGDVDADWVAGHSVGDETPAGDNPTPGMSVVEDIGKALGVQYQDAEELKPVEKIAVRDRHRWELDPASSEDWPHDDDKE
jgi:hypothetical protein